jgi:cytidylate kinase
MSDVQSALQAIVSAINTISSDGAKAPAKVVCISRDYGAGGDEVAQILAKRLGVNVYDQVILDRMTQRLDSDKETLKALDSGASRVRDLWLYSLVTGKALNANTYRRHLNNVVLSIGRTGGVILGQGAHLILARSGALRVRFIGSPEVCAARVAAAEKIDLEAARAKVHAANDHRGKFIWDTFQQRLNDPHTFDLVINTDHITDNAKLVDMLVDAMNMVGPPAP